MNQPSQSIISKRLEEFSQYASKFYIDVSDLNRASTIWHYTNIESLFGMLETNSIWLSDHRMLNDKGEIIFPKRLISDHYLDAMGGVGGQLVKAAFGNRNDEFEIESLNNPVFVASFSAEKDCLSQWKGYASGQHGISIGFDVIELLKSPKSWFLNLVRVRYDDHEINDLIRNFMKLYWEVKRMIPELDSENQKQCEIIYYTGVLQLEVAIKSKEWIEESEYRIVCRDHMLQTKYRLKNGYITAYKAPEFNLNKCINEIVMIENDRYKEQLIREYLTSKGMKDVKISHSRLNMRF